MTDKSIFASAVMSDPERSYRIRDFLAVFDSRLANLPDPGTPAAPEPPAGEVQAGEPGPASADGTTIPGPVAGPGSGPETSAPGAAHEDADPAAPPAEPADSAAVPGAEDEAAQDPEPPAAPSSTEPSPEGDA